jgi:translation initiation factor 6 (eIF-6)
LRMAIFNNDSISEDLDVEDNAAMDDWIAVSVSAASIKSSTTVGKYSVISQSRSSSSWLPVNFLIFNDNALT